MKGGELRKRGKREREKSENRIGKVEINGNGREKEGKKRVKRCRSISSCTRVTERKNKGSRRGNTKERGELFYYYV